MLYVVIPVFNRKHFTKACLLSLREQTASSFKVIVVDDGSTDGTADMLREEFSEVIAIDGGGDLWWTAATNLGIRHALQNGATYVMTLNNDTLAPKDFIEKMLFWSSQKPTALLGAFAIDSVSRLPIYGGEIMHWSTNTTTHLLKKLPFEKQVGLHKVTHFPGRGLLISKQVFDTIGLFDEKNFPHYYADYDFSYKATRYGFEVYCNYDAKIYTYPDESGDRENRKKKSLKNYYNHLFGIRGGGNLINFTRFTLRNCPPLYVPFVLLNGYFRRFFGYLVK